MAFGEVKVVIEGFEEWTHALNELISRIEKLEKRFEQTLEANNLWDGS